MNVCPGAIYQPISAAQFGGRARRRKGRGFIGHVAVSESQNLRPSSTAADWHFYIPRVGPNFYQYVDLDFVAYAQLEGNADLVSAETQGGVHGPDTEPWSPFQVATLAHIFKYLHDSESVPLRLMASSAASEKGFGYHRLGIDPWRLPNTQKWSSSRGKLCPGAAKIAQAPQVVALAAGQQEGDDMPSFDDVIHWTNPETGKPLDNTFAQLLVWTNWYAGKTNTAVSELTDEVKALREEVAALKKA